MKRLAAVLALAAAAGTGACARHPIQGQQAPALDRKLSTFVWIEEGNVANLLVGTRATRYRDKDPYVPIEICVANVGLKQLTLARESFVLVDADGNRYPAAGPKELLEGYDFLDLDRRLQDIEGVTFNRFATYTIYPSKFSPTRRGPVRPGESSLVRDSITLPKFGYLIDFLYFPKPATGVVGRRFELFMSAPELDNPVFVKFEVK